MLSAAWEAALNGLPAAGTLYAFDFDGTLAPIVERPRDAAMPAATAAAFAALCAVAPVAIVTGRSVADVLPRLPHAPRFVVGNHGAEIAGVPEPRADGWRTACQRWQDALRAVLAQAGAGQGVEFESKGATLSVHYRRAPRPAAVASLLREAAAALDPAPRVIGGKRVVNLLPGDAPTKLDALRAICAAHGLDTAFFAGDDETDEMVFRGAPAHWVTVRVDGARRSAARFRMSSVRDVPVLLERLIAHEVGAAMPPP